MMHCFREANRCADALAQKCPIIQQDFVVYDSPPVDIVMLLYYDQIGHVLWDDSSSNNCFSWAVFNNILLFIKK